MAKVSESSLFEELTVEQRIDLWNEDRPLYGALFKLEYGFWPDSFITAEENESQKVIDRIKEKELPYLKTLGYDELRKQGKLNRLKNMDLAYFMRKMREWDKGSRENALWFKANHNNIGGLNLSNASISNSVFSDKSWDELHESNLLGLLKTRDLPLFKKLFKEAHGVDYRV